MDIWEAIRTTRAMRRLSDRPVPTEDIWKILEAATKGPSGSNAQPVRWIVVTDPDKRAAQPEEAAIVQTQSPAATSGR